mmetsp:Transcript_20467/g.25851  ORF Transcript_20467/g.25851 Transcript_20467/m.25851 type:complete len:226 (-) Transcript_20467:76-753(-)
MLCLHKAFVFLIKSLKLFCERVHIFIITFIISMMQNLCLNLSFPLFELSIFHSGSEVVKKFMKSNLARSRDINSIENYSLGIAICFQTKFRKNFLEITRAEHLVAIMIKAIKDYTHCPTTSILHHLLLKLLFEHSQDLLCIQSLVITVILFIPPPFCSLPHGPQGHRAMRGFPFAVRLLGHTFCHFEKFHVFYSSVAILIKPVDQSLHLSRTEGHPKFFHYFFKF